MPAGRHEGPSESPGRSSALRGRQEEEESQEAQQGRRRKQGLDPKARDRGEVRAKSEHITTQFKSRKGENVTGDHQRIEENSKCCFSFRNAVSSLTETQEE